jgi:hypothetical protein
MESSVLSGINNYEFMKSSDFLWAQIISLVSERLFFDDGFHLVGGVVLFGHFLC